MADNHRNVGDIADTAVHEAVGHHGLRQLFETEEKFNNFLDEAYNISNDRIKAEMDRRGKRMMEEEIIRLQERKRENAENGEREPDGGQSADCGRGTEAVGGEGNYVKPVGRGKFGDIFAAFRGKAKAAWQYLSALKSGQARGVFYRPEIGEIDLVWGEAPTPYLWWISTILTTPSTSIR